MPATQDLIGRIQTLVDDQAGLNFATADFLLPLVRQVSDEVFAKIAGYDVSFDEQRLVLNNVAAGTTDLSAYSASGQPLEFLFSPMRLEWKQRGLDDTNYLEAGRVDNLGDQVNTPEVTEWEYRSGIIYITPATIAVDLRLRGEFLPGPIQSLDQPIMASAMLTLAYLTAALVGIVRGNPGWIQLYGNKGEEALDALERKLVKQDQAISRSFGGSRSRRRLGGWPHA